MNKIKTVGIIGAGTMGLGIAQVCALAGYKTVMYDTRPEACAQGMRVIETNMEKGIEIGKLSSEAKTDALALITCVVSLDEVQTDLILEAVVEQLDIKQQIFTLLEQVNGEETILATNTSSIPVTQIAAGLKRPEKVVGLHFFNPAHIMKLVEVIAGAATAENTLSRTRSFAESLGKTVVSAQDSPGFIVNRVARHFYVESLRALEEGVADVAAIDKLVESSGFRLGPFRLMDLIGVDTNFSVTQSMFNAFHQDAKFRPNRIQQQKVDAGHWGKKVGKGFYDYDA